MIVYCVIVIQCSLILYCLVATMIYRNIAPCILKTKRKYNKKIIVAFSILTMSSINVLITMDKNSLIIIGCVIMFFCVDF